MTRSLRLGLVALGLLASAPGFGQSAAPPTKPEVGVWIAPSAAELRPLLEEELPADALRAELGPGDLRLELEDDGSALTLRLRGSDDRGLLDRRFELGLGRVAALRAGALAVQGAWAAEVAARGTQTRSAAPLGPNPGATSSSSSDPPGTSGPNPDERPSGAASPTPSGDPAEAPDLGPASPSEAETPSPPPAEVPRLETAAPAPTWLGLRFGGTALWAGGVPQLGLQLSATLRLGELSLGLGGAYAGLGCCGPSVDAGLDTALEGELQVGLLSFGADWVAWRPLGLALGAGIELGAERLQLQVTPRIFQGQPLTTEVSGWSGLGRVALVARGPLFGARLGWRLDLGLELRNQPPTVALPAGFPLSSESLKIGSVGPFLNLGLELGLL